MAQMTLQRASHVFNRIKTETAFNTVEEDDPYASYGRRRSREKPRNTFTTSVNVSVDAPVRQQADAYRNLLIGKLGNLFRLMEIGTRIRTRMTDTQTHCGVTAWVTKRVMVTNKIKVLEHLLDAITETNVYNPELFEEQAALIRQRLNAATQSGNTTATVTTTVLNSEDRADLASRLAAERSILMGIDDQLAVLNATHHIQVDDEDMKFLQEAGLAA